MASDRSEVDYGNVCMLKPLNIVNGRRTGRKDYGNQYEERELRRSGLPCSLFSLVLVVMKWVTAAQARRSLGPTLAAASPLEGSGGGGMEPPAPTPLPSHGVGFTLSFLPDLLSFLPVLLSFLPAVPGQGLPKRPLAPPCLGYSLLTRDTLVFPLE